MQLINRSTREQFEHNMNFVFADAWFCPWEAENCIQLNWAAWEYTGPHLKLWANASSCAQHTMRPNNTKTSELGAEKGLLQGHARRQVACTQKTLSSPKFCSKAFLKARWGRGTVCCCKLLGVGTFVLAAVHLGRSGHDVLVNLPQDRCYSLFCSFLSLCEWKSVIPLKVRALRMDYPVYFRL